MVQASFAIFVRIQRLGKHSNWEKKQLFIFSLLSKPDLLAAKNFGVINWFLRP